MGVDELIRWAFQGIATGAIVYGVKEMGRLRESIEKLNVSVAVVIEKVAGHEKILDRHDERILDLETNKES